GKSLDTTSYKIAVLNESTGAMAYADWVTAVTTVSASNGLSESGGDVKLGSLFWTETASPLEKPRLISVKSRLALGAPRSPLIIGNRMTRDSLLVDNPVDSVQGGTYGATMLHLNANYKEEWGDTLQLQYNGPLSILSRRSWDSASTRFAAGNKDVWLDNANIDLHQQYYPPRDSARVRV